MTDPDAAGGGGEYQVVVGKFLHIFFCLSITPLILPSPLRSALAIAQADDQDSDGQTA